MKINSRNRTALRIIYLVVLFLLMPESVTINRTTIINYTVLIDKPISIPVELPKKPTLSLVLNYFIDSLHISQDTAVFLTAITLHETGGYTCLLTKDNQNICGLRHRAGTMKHNYLVYNHWTESLKDLVYYDRKYGKRSNYRQKRYAILSSYYPKIRETLTNYN